MPRDALVSGGIMDGLSKGGEVSHAAKRRARLRGTGAPVGNARVGNTRVGNTRVTGARIASPAIASAASSGGSHITRLW